MTGWIRKIARSAAVLIGSLNSLGDPARGDEQGICAPLSG